MYQVEQHQILSGHEWWAYCDRACFASKNLYNTAQYTQRQGLIYGHGIQSIAKLDKMFNSLEHYQALPAKVSQVVFKQNTDAWNGYFLALKEVSRLRSQIGLGTSSKMQNIIRNRNNFVHSYLHQATRMIVDQLSDIGVTHVAIGKNPQWKTAINMRRKNNQQFVQVHHAKFVSMLTQKLERVGITITND